VLPEITIPPFSPGHLPPCSRWHGHLEDAGCAERGVGMGLASPPEWDGTGTVGLGSSIPMLQRCSEHTPSLMGISLHPFLKPQILKQPLKKKMLPLNFFFKFLAECFCTSEQGRFIPIDIYRDIS